MNNKRIVWSEDYSVEHDSLDRQHEELITIYNILVEFSEYSMVTISFLNDIIEILVNYSNYHFGIEESLFQEYNYPESESHIKEHRNFIDKVKYFKEKKKDDQANDLLEFLHNYIIEHLTVSDKKYFDYFQEAQKV